MILCKDFIRTKTCLSRELQVTIFNSNLTYFNCKLIVGFVGKVIIEKLLRACPDVRGIYLLMRPKRGRFGKDRIADLTNSNVCF